MTPRQVLQGLRDICRERAGWIRRDVAVNRIFYTCPGTLAWDLDNVRLAWADFLEALAGGAQ